MWYPCGGPYYITDDEESLVNPANVSGFSIIGPDPKLDLPERLQLITHWGMGLKGAKADLYEFALEHRHPETPENLMALLYWQMVLQKSASEAKALEKFEELNSEVQQIVLNAIESLSVPLWDTAWDEFLLDNGSASPEQVRTAARANKATVVEADTALQFLNREYEVGCAEETV